MTKRELISNKKLITLMYQGADPRKQRNLDGKVDPWDMIEEEGLLTD